MTHNNTSASIATKASKKRSSKKSAGKSAKRSSRQSPKKSSKKKGVKTVKASSKSNIQDAGDNKSPRLNSTLKPPSEYPLIYSYIYEREPQDIERLFTSHTKTKKSRKKGTIKVVGFKLVDGQIKVVTQLTVTKGSAKVKKKAVKKANK